MCLESKISKIQQLKRFINERKAFNLIANKSFGIKQDHIFVTEFELNKDEFAIREKDKQEGDFYIFQGPPSERDFCKYMLNLDKVFSSGEVQQLGDLLGYMTFDGLEYVPGEIMPFGGPGGPNCRHSWRKFRGKYVLTPAPTENQIRTLISKSVFE